MTEGTDETKETETKITTVEKVKDPRRVEAGKKLGAMSRQAKEKKAVAASEASRVALKTDEFSLASFPSVDPLVVVGVVGLAGLVVYYKFVKKFPAERSSEANQDEPLTTEVAKSVENTQNTQPKPKRVYRELDTLG